MKAILIVMSLMLVATSFSSLAQQNDTDFDRMKRRMELREEAHRRMIDKVLRGRLSDQDDLFGDLEKMFNDMMKETGPGFVPRDEFAINSQNFTSDWKSDDKGKTLVLTPMDESIQLDINVKDQYITIGAKQERKDENSYVESSSSSVFPVPHECDGSRVQMKSVDKSIHVFFPYRDAKSAPKSITYPQKKNGDQIDRRPIKPSASDVEI